MMSERKLICLVTQTTEMSMLIQIQQVIVKGDISRSFWNYRRVWRYQRGNQNPYIEEGQTTQTDKQRSTKHTHQTTDIVTWTLLKTGGELRCPGRVGSSWSTSGTRRVNLVTNTVISREWGKDREVFTSGTYPWS